MAVNCTIDGLKFYNAGWSNDYSTTLAYVGYNSSTNSGSGSYYTCIMKIDISGIESDTASRNLSIKLHLEKEYHSNLDINYALCTSDENKSLYVNTTSIPNDNTRLFSGSENFTDITASTDKYITISTNGSIGNGTYYLILWSSYGPTDAANSGSGRYVKIRSNSSTVTLATVKKYTVTLKPNGGNGSDILLTKYENEDLTILSSYNPSRSSESSGTLRIHGQIGENVYDHNATRYTNYIFSKWNTKSDGTGENYDQNSIYRINKNIILYAQYDHNYTYENNRIPSNWWDFTEVRQRMSGQYTVYFDGNSGECTVESLSSDHMGIYLFDGWYSDFNGTGTEYNRSSELVPTSDDIETYGILIHAKLNFQYSIPAEDIILPGPDTVTRKGYEFIGWNTNADGSGTSYEYGSSYTPTSISTPITLYAIYKPKGLVRINTPSSFREALTWIFKNNKWVQAIPNIFSNNKWNIGG